MKDTININKIHCGPGDRYGFQGEVLGKCWGPEMSGITLEQISLIMKHPLSQSVQEMNHEIGRNYKNWYDRGARERIPHPTMRRVVDEVVIPFTKGTEMSFALLLNHARPVQAKVMVSHAWDEEFDQFLACVTPETPQVSMYDHMKFATHQIDKEEQQEENKSVDEEPNGPF